MNIGTHHIVNLDNAVTLLRLKQYQSKLTAPEATLLDLAIYHAIKKIDDDCGLPGFDTAAAFQEFFGRPIE
jgi:hypothetical protein